MKKQPLKTKIVGTLGPATQEDSIVEALMEAGLDVIRLNFSHENHEVHLANIERVKRVRTKLGKHVPIMLDTRGPEIRLGMFSAGKVSLVTGQTFTLYTEEIDGDETKAHINYANLPKDVKIGDRILIDDGLVAMAITEIYDDRLVCQVENNGIIGTRKSVNVPNVRLSMPYISEKDKDDILFGVKNGVDFIATSFTRSAEDVLEVRKLIGLADEGDVRIIAKIENMEGVNNVDEILRVSDGIMVARGDLGVEIPFEKVPVYQKMLITKAYSSGKRVITATQMLEGMVKNPRPTRAEAADVANAIYDGTSAIMLSGETAAGDYPVEAVKTMVRIAASAEEDINYDKRFRNRELDTQTDVTNAISHATCTTALDLQAKAIITVTQSGRTARMLSKYRPSSPIICCSTSEQVCRHLNLSWGVVPLLLQEMDNADALFEAAIQKGESEGLLEQGDLVVMTAGLPLGVSGTTNLMKVEVVGNILVTGKGVTLEKSNGCLHVCTEENEDSFKDGDILVATQTDHRLLPLIRRAAGLILEDDNANGHGAIAGMSLNIPVIIGATNATRILKSGISVTMDAERGVVFSKISKN